MQNDGNTAWRAWHKLTGWLGQDVVPSDDPEALLQQAQEAMRQSHERNRELAVQAITQKNNLQQMLLDTRRKTEVLTEQANAAELRDDELRAFQLRQEVAAYREAVEITERQLKEAEATVEQVKRTVQSEAEMIWCKTAEALSLRVQWKAVQIETELARWEMERSAGQTRQLDEASRYLHHRRLLVEAVIGKNQLAEMTSELNGQIAEMGRKAEYAEKQGVERLATHLLRTREQHEATLARVQAVSERTDQVVERAKELLEAEYQSLMEREVVIPNEADVLVPVIKDQSHGRRRRAARLAAALTACLLLLFLIVR